MTSEAIMKYLSERNCACNLDEIFYSVYFNLNHIDVNSRGCGLRLYYQSFNVEHLNPSAEKLQTLTVCIVSQSKFSRNFKSQQISSLRSEGNGIKPGISINEHSENFRLRADAEKWEQTRNLNGSVVY